MTPAYHVIFAKQPEVRMKARGVRPGLEAGRHPGSPKARDNHKELAINLGISGCCKAGFSSKG